MTVPKALSILCIPLKMGSTNLRKLETKGTLPKLFATPPIALSAIAAGCSHHFVSSSISNSPDGCGDFGWKTVSYWSKSKGIIFLVTGDGGTYCGDGWAAGWAKGETGAGCLDATTGDGVTSPAHVMGGRSPGSLKGDTGARGAIGLIGCKCRNAILNPIR